MTLIIIEFTLSLDNFEFIDNMDWNEITFLLDERIWTKNEWNIYYPLILKLMICQVPKKEDLSYSYYDSYDKRNLSLIEP